MIPPTRAHRRRRELQPVWLALVLLLMVACGPRTTPSGPIATTPVGPASPPPITATLPDGSVVQLELALTPDEISRGLMFRPSLPADRGMLFVFTETRNPTFWMKDTRIPLDIVFLDEGGTVVSIEHGAPPCAAEPCPRYTSHLPSRAVLELAAGVAAQRAIGEGSLIRFEGVPGYPLGG